jgi:hypothetical protein
MLGGLMQNPQMQMLLVGLMAQLMGGNPMLAAILMQEGGLGGKDGAQQPKSPGGQTPQNNPLGGMGGFF